MKKKTLNIIVIGLLVVILLLGFLLVVEVKYSNYLYAERALLQEEIKDRDCLNFGTAQPGSEEYEIYREQLQETGHYIECIESYLE